MNHWGGCSSTWTFNKKVERNYKKKTERGEPHMLAPRRRCFGYSKVYCDVRKRWVLAWNQNKHITYSIFHIPYTNSEISIGLLYICPHFVWWHRLNPVYNFQSMESPVELNRLLSRFFCYITWLLYQLIRSDTGRLANEAFTSNLIVSSKQ